MSRPCGFFDQAVGLCDRVVFHDTVKDDAMMMLVVFLIGICWLMLKAFDTADD